MEKWRANQAQHCFILYIPLSSSLWVYSHLFPFPSSSFKIRFLKSSTIRGNPSRRETLGSQLRSSFALLISGFLLWGSSAVFGLNSIVALGSMVSFTTYYFKMIINQNRAKYCAEKKNRKKSLSRANLSKLQHSKFSWITQIERAHVLTFHQCHQSIDLI